MKSILRLSAGSILAAAMLTSAFGVPARADDAALYAAAKKEGPVNWYTGFVQNQLVRPIVAGFEAKYPGVKVNATAGRDTDIMVKILSEAKAGALQADMVEGPSVVRPLKQAGLIEPYFPDNGAKLPADYKDPDGQWTAVVLHFLTPAVNTDLVPAAEEPKSLDDLLDPKWKGKMAWSAEMTVGGPPGFIGAVLHELGEEKGMDYLHKLAAQKIATIPSNPRVVLDQVIAGQYSIGLVTYNHHSAISAAKGAPVKWLPINPVVGAMAREVLLKGGPHPNGAKLLIDYLLSPDGQKVIQQAGYIPSNPDVDATQPSLKPQVGGFKVYTPTPADEEQNMDKWIGIYKQLFQ